MRTPLNRRSLLLAILSVCAGRHAYALDRPRLIVLGAAVTSPIVALGVGGAIAPKREMSLRGWLVCNGAEASRATYAELFASLGTKFGDGDGSTTFNLPSRDVEMNGAEVIRGTAICPNGPIVSALMPFDTTSNV